MLNCWSIHIFFLIQLIRHTAMLLENLGENHAVRDKMMKEDLEPCLEGWVLKSHTTKTVTHINIQWNLTYNEVGYNKILL